MKRVRINDDDAECLMDGDEARIVFWETQRRAMIDTITEKIKSQGFVESLQLRTEEYTKRKYYEIAVFFVCDLCLPSGIIEGQFGGNARFTFTFGIHVWEEFLLGFYRLWDEIKNTIQPKIESVFKDQKVDMPSWGTHNTSCISYYIRIYSN